MILKPASAFPVIIHPVDSLRHLGNCSHRDHITKLPVSVQFECLAPHAVGNKLQRGLCLPKGPFLLVKGDPLTPELLPEPSIRLMLCIKLLPEPLIRLMLCSVRLIPRATCSLNPNTCVTLHAVFTLTELTTHLYRSCLHCGRAIGPGPGLCVVGLVQEQGN